MLKNGDKARDIITGFEGIVTAECKYLTGCEQILLNPGRLQAESGAPVESCWFDIDRLELVEVDAVKIKVTAPGGDIPAPIK